MERRYDIDWLRVSATYLLFVFHVGKVFDPAPFYHVRNAEVSALICDSALPACMECEHRIFPTPVLRPYHLRGQGIPPAHRGRDEQLMGFGPSAPRPTVIRRGAGR